MNCRKAVKLLKDLPLRQAPEAVKAHFANCRACQEVLRHAKRVDDLLREKTAMATRESAGPRDTSKLMEMLDARGEERAPELVLRRSRVRLVLETAMAAALVVALILLFDARRQLRQRNGLPVAMTHGGLSKSVVESEAQMFSELEDLLPNRLQWIVDANDDVYVAALPELSAEQIGEPVPQKLLVLLFQVTRSDEGEAAPPVQEAIITAPPGRRVTTSIPISVAGRKLSLRYSYVAILRRDGRVGISLDLAASPEDASAPEVSITTTLIATQNEPTRVGGVRLDGGEYAVSLLAASTAVQELDTSM